jgi:hypothetical protein
MEGFIVLSRPSELLPADFWLLQSIVNFVDGACVVPCINLRIWPNTARLVKRRHVLLAYQRLGARALFKG